MGGYGIRTYIDITFELHPQIIFLRAYLIIA